MTKLSVESIIVGHIKVKYDLREQNVARKVEGRLRGGVGGGGDEWVKTHLSVHNHFPL